MVLTQIIIATLLVGVLSFIGIVFFAFKLNIRKITFYLISLASGTMLGAAFLHLIPQSLASQKELNLIPIGLGIFFFFILEKFLVWRHCHHHQRPEDHSRPVAARMVLFGDAIHNFIDGIIIASAFMVSPHVGISITLAIMLHEIPQELGDFGVLIHGGMSTRQAFLMNALTALAAVLGGLLTYFFIGHSIWLQTLIVPMAAGGFLYIALADLIPQLHVQTSGSQSLAQIALLSTGFGLMALIHHLSHA